MADPVTGLLFTTSFLPAAQEAGQRLSRLADKPNRPIFSRLNSTLSRVLKGRQTSSAASVQAMADAPETPAMSSSDPTVAGPPATADETAAASSPSTDENAIADLEAAAVIAPDVETALTEEEQPSPAAKPPEAEPISEAVPAVTETLDELPNTSVSEESAEPAALSLAQEPSAADGDVTSQPLDLSLSAADAADAIEEEKAVPPVSTDPSDAASVQPTKPLPGSEEEPADDEAEASTRDTTIAPEADRQTKAPAKLTDADELRRKTLDSLNQFQQQLRQELAE